MTTEEESPEQFIELGTPESWDEAIKIANLIGEVPSLFSNALHFLRVDARDNNGTLGTHSKQTLKVLLNSPSFTAALHKAALTYRPRDTEGKVFKSRIAMAEIFSAGELHSLVSMLYLYRRIRKGCDPELFADHSAALIRDLELGGLIGTAIPGIGLKMALLVTGFPFLGMAMFLGIDKQGYKKQKTRLKINNERYNLELEQERWGCNHLQITALLLQSMSAGAKIFDAVVLGLSAKTLEDAEAAESPDVYRAKLTRVWLDNLLETGKSPDMTHKGEYYPLTDDLRVLEASANTVRENGRISGWLEAKRSDYMADCFPDEVEDDLDELISDDES